MKSPTMHYIAHEPGGGPDVMRIQEKAAIAQCLRQHVWPLLESGKIKVVIDRIFPLEKASEAHCVMEEGQHIGKILLQVQGSLIVHAQDPP